MYSSCIACDHSGSNQHLKARFGKGYCVELKLTKHDATTKEAFDLSKEDIRVACEALNVKALSTPGINIVDVTLAGKPHTLTAKQEPVLNEEGEETHPAGMWDLPAKGKLEMNVVTLSRTDIGKEATHGDVLRLEESLADSLPKKPPGPMKDAEEDEEKYKFLDTALRVGLGATPSKSRSKEPTVWLLADQAAKLVELFVTRKARVRALAILLPQIVNIHQYEQMRGCLDGATVEEEPEASA